MGVLRPVVCQQVLELALAPLCQASGRSDQPAWLRAVYSARLRTGCSPACITILEKARPEIWNTTIHDNREAGIRVFEDGGGEVSGSTLFNNGSTNIKEDPDGFLHVIGCRLD
jgi:hypothetical protein